VLPPRDHRLRCRRGTPTDRSGRRAALAAQVGGPIRCIGAARVLGAGEPGVVARSFDEGSVEAAIRRNRREARGGRLGIERRRGVVHGRSRAVLPPSAWRSTGKGRRQVRCRPDGTALILTRARSRPCSERARGRCGVLYHHPRHVALNQVPTAPRLPWLSLSGGEAACERDRALIGALIQMIYCRHVIRRRDRWERASIRFSSLLAREADLRPVLAKSKAVVRPILRVAAR